MDFCFSLFLKLIFSPLYFIAWMFRNILWKFVFAFFGCLLISTRHPPFFGLAMLIAIIVISLLFNADSFDSTEKFSAKIFKRLNFTNIHFFSDLFTKNIIKGKYEKKWGMKVNQIEDFISKRWSLGNNRGIQLYVLPLINQVCRLNVDAKNEQIAFLSNLLSEEEIELVIETVYSDEQIEVANQYWQGRYFIEQKSMMDLLFRLTIEKDGIHNDEWNLLMRKLTLFGIEDVIYFIQRYSSLRTEFDDQYYNRKSSTSQNRKSEANLRPYYAVLGLREGASIEEIKQAYHELALQHHPDLPKNASRIEECEKLMVKINEAYEQLEKRKL